MSHPPEEGRTREEPELGAVSTETGLPPGEPSWDIPLDDGPLEASRIPRPDPRNNPRLELYSRGLAAVGALFLAGAFAAWLFLADTESVARLFFNGEPTITPRGVLILAGITALGSILLVVLLHPVMRALVRSRVPPRTLDVTQRAILETIPSPLFFLNTEARLEEVNSAFAKAVGGTASNMIGRSLYDFIPEDDQEEAYQALLKVTAREKEGFRCPIMTRRGVRTFNITAEPYQGHNAESYYIVGIGLDVTEDKVASEALASKYEDMHQAALQTLEMIAHVVEIRDPYLHGHHERVAQICVALADLLGVPEDEKTGIELAARAHDIGTIRIPFEIQIKPGSLTDAEASIIEQHAQAGAEILGRIDFPWPVAEIVGQHHEFFDGSGYPNGLKGTDITIGARILAVADAYDALVSQRPYRAAVTRAEALQRIVSLSGKHYDPRVVSALSTHLQVASTKPK